VYALLFYCGNTPPLTCPFGHIKKMVLDPLIKRSVFGKLFDQDIQVSNMAHAGTFA
jgi:hypothetical protein